MTAFIACGYSLAWKHFHGAANWSDNVSLVAGVISIAVLGGIGLLNARVAVDLFFEWSRMRKCSHDAQDAAEKSVAEASLRTALSSLPCLSWVFDHVDRAEKMYFVGFIFGLSFDTATQVGLIGLAAMASSTDAVPAAIAMVIPLCFSTGMCLVDSGNGLLMLLAYTWATVRPAEKLLYNFFVTAMSALVALLIGSLEMLQMLAQQSKLKGSPWKQIGKVDMASVGFFIILTFSAIFALSTLWPFIHRHCQPQTNSGPVICLV
jgi:high-affinity nickel-transport protein